MNPRTKIKVSRTAILEKVKESRSAALAEHEASIAKYEADLASYTDKVQVWLEKVRAAARKTLEKADFDIADVYSRGSYRDCLVLPKVPEKPEKPSKPGPVSTKNIDAAIAQLEMSVEDVISISVEDYSLYIGS